MDEDDLIQALRARSHDGARRTDYADRGVPDLAPHATNEMVSLAEKDIGVALHPLHRRLLTEVGNGGFGPGDGLVGLPGGRVDGDGRSILDLRQQLLGREIRSQSTIPVVHLCEWGDGIWSCLDERSGHVLTLTEDGLFDTGVSLFDWMTAWLSGESLFQKMFTFEDRSGINPFTKKVITTRVPARPIGVPYLPQS